MDRAGGRKQAPVSALYFDRSVNSRVKENMPSGKKKGSKKNRKPSVAKGKQNAADDGRDTELPPKRHSDEELFSSGHESFVGVCPICGHPMPLDPSRYFFMPG